MAAVYFRGDIVNEETEKPIDILPGRKSSPVSLRRLEGKGEIINQSLKDAGN